MFAERITVDDFLLIFIIARLYILFYFFCCSFSKIDIHE